MSDALARKSGTREPIRCPIFVRCSSARNNLATAKQIPISRPTDATCDRFLFSIYMCITLHVSSVKRSSSGVSHLTYSLQFLCLCLSTALSVPQIDTNTETGGFMYGEELLIMSAWHSKHVELYTYRQKIKIYHKLHLLVYLLEYMKMHGPGNIKSLNRSLGNWILVSFTNIWKQFATLNQ
jgi:hypothetical protein